MSLPELTAAERRAKYAEARDEGRTEWAAERIAQWPNLPTLWGAAESERLYKAEKASAAVTR
jgi:hypothetical protein